MTVLSILVTGLLFGSLGYVCSRSVRPRWQLGLVLFLLAIAGGWLGVNTSLAGL